MAIKKAQADFRRIIDRVIEHGGRFYLTYHAWATREQVETCYPRFSEFLDAKLMHDPECRFQSDWYRHYATLYFVFAVDDTESDLGILDLIQVMVEALDRQFKNVCELDIMFNLEKAHFILDEMVMNGCIIETNKNNVLQPIQILDKAGS